jgi:monofunctional biosynthetic peptidoglycan transglycosylase
MEVYLNSIEMGNGVYGAQAAAEHWYRKDAKDLTIQAAAGIAAFCLILENSLQPVRRPTSIIERENYASDANGRENKILKYVKRHI